MSSDASLLQLCAPGTPLESELLAHLQRAVRQGRRAWYLAPDARTGRRRSAALSPLPDPPVGTLRDLAIRLLRAAGHSLHPPHPRVSEGLLQRALARQAAALPRGARSVEGANHCVGALLRDGWTGASIARQLCRLEERGSADVRLSTLWRALEALCPGIDGDEPLRRVLSAGLLQGHAPDLLLIEGGPLSGELSTRLLQELVRRVLGRGGEVRACCLDLPAGGGPRGRMVELLLDLLPGPPSRSLAVRVPSD